MSKFASVLLCLSSTATAALGVATSSFPNSPNEQPQLRGGVVASVESGRGVSCYNEVVFTIRCDDGTMATYDAVNDGGCNDAWASGRARHFLNEYCGVFGGGTASASCELICPTTPTRRVIPSTIDSIDCTWSPSRRRLFTCPDTFDRDFTEIYYCDNGQDVCCTFSRTIGRVHLDGLGSTCSRDFNKAEQAEDEKGQGGLLSSDEEQGYLLQVVSEAHSPEEAGVGGDGGVRVNGGEECSPETIVELTCNNGGGSKGEMVSMTCSEAKAAAPGMLKDFCGKKGGGYKVDCPVICPDGPGGNGNPDGPGGNSDPDGPGGSGEGCSPETIVELTCKNGGGSKGEMVSMTCDEAKAAAPGMLKDFCGKKGGTWKVDCPVICPDGPGGNGHDQNSIKCKYHVPATNSITCPDTFNPVYSENYTCDNGYHICCTDSNINEVKDDKMVCTRDSGVTAPVLLEA